MFKGVLLPGIPVKGLFVFELRVTQITDFSGLGRVQVQLVAIMTHII